MPSLPRLLLSPPRWVLPIAVVVNLVALFLPGGGGPMLFPGADKVVHVALFAGVAWPAVRRGLPWPAVVLLLGLHAVCSELIQHHLIPGRSADPADVVADLVGIALGVVLALRVPPAPPGVTRSSRPVRRRRPARPG